MTYVNPLSVRCSFCHASLGEQCSMPGPKDMKIPLGNGRVHPSRIVAAALATGFSEAEAHELASSELMTRIATYRRRHGASSLLDAQNRNFGETCSESLAQPAGEA